MAWSLDDGDTKTWEELLYHGSSFLYLEDPDVNQAIVDVWDAGQASWEICEVHAPTNQEHDAPPDDSTEFYWPDGEKEKYTEHEIQYKEKMIEDSLDSLASSDDSTEFYWPDGEKEKYREHEIEYIEKIIKGEDNYCAKK